MSKSTSVKETEKNECYHCGLPCDTQDILFESNHFCCEGCKTVYSILSKNDLKDYYSLEDKPGNNLSTVADEQKFKFLDNKDIQKRLLIFQSDDFCKVQFFVPSIHCSSCIWLLENLGHIEHGISQSSVNFSNKEVEIDFNPRIISLKEVAMLLASLGYEPLINLEQTNRKRAGTQNRDLLIKIGVAGFCFGNIMLLSFPEYLGFENDIESEFQQVFTIAMLILSLPVLLYCSTDYLTSSLYSLRQKQINIDVPISLGIVALYSRSVYEIFTGTGPGYLDSFAGLLFFLLIGKWFQSKTYEGLSYDRDYRSYFPLAVTRVSKDVHEDIISTDLMKGDRIFIRNNELIPADSVLISPRANIDYSFVTGESNPVECSSGKEIFAGGRQVGSAIELEVIKEVSGSYLSKLWDNEAFSKEDRADEQNLIDRVSKYFTLVVLGIALISSAIWSIYDVGTAVNVLTAVLIVACPCALALSTPFTLGSTLRLFGSKKLFLRNAAVVEQLNRVTHIVFDKTGTITENEKSQISYEGADLASHKELIATVVLSSTHPLSRKLSKHLGSTRTIEIDAFEETESKGIKAQYGKTIIKVGSAVLTNAPEQDDLKSSVHININGKYFGRFIFENHYRSGFRTLISSISDQFNISVLSGDNESELHTLRSLLPTESTISFNQSPYDKLEYIRSLQEKGECVMMLGDGLNDSGALKQSNVGIAVTDNITSFTPASDGILDGEKLTWLGQFLSFATTSRRIIIASFIISFLYNITGLSFAVAGLLTPLFAAILMPLSSITVVLFTTTAVTLLGRKEFHGNE